LLVYDLTEIKIDSYILASTAGSAIVKLALVTLLIIKRLFTHNQTLPEPLLLTYPTQSDTMNRPPTFSGRNPDKYSVDQFIAEMDLYYALANPPILRKIIIFDAAIQQPAKRHFDAQNTTDAFGVRPAVAADNDNDGVREAYFQLQYQARIQWLQDRYNGPEQQRVVRSQLFQNFQGPNESPRAFFDRIEDQLVRAGLPAPQNDVTLEQIFIQGLHPEIALHVQILPFNTIDQILKAAENYWRILNNPRYNNRPKTIASRTPGVLPNLRYLEEEPLAP
jgi:hypothetical protein